MNNWAVFLVFVGGVIILLNMGDKNEPRQTHVSHYASTATHDKSRHATALCWDGTYSYSSNRRGTCSHHGGVKHWLNAPQSSPATTPTYVPPPPSHPTYATAKCWNDTNSYSHNPSHVCANQQGVKRELNGYQQSTQRHTNHTSSPTQSVQNPFDAPTNTTQNETAQHHQPVQQMTVDEVQKLYETEVANINQAWQALDPDVRNHLRPAQRVINKQRERERTAYGKTQSDVSQIQQAYRYLCEIPRLQERTKYLQEQANIPLIKLSG